MQHLESTEFYQGFVEQKELFSSQSPAADLRGYINSYWTLRVESGSFSYRGVPDNCVDWIIDIDNPQNSGLVSPHSTPLDFTFTGPANYFGIRFKTLAQYSFTNVPISEWIETAQRQQASEYLSDRQILKSTEILESPFKLQVLEVLSTDKHFRRQCKKIEIILRDYLLKQNNLSRSLAIDTRLIRLIDLSKKEPGSEKTHTKQLANEIGISTRQLRRLSHLYLGISPKEFLKVQRFQKTLHLLNTQQHASPWLDYYFDQSHFIREFKALSGATPGQFMKMSVLSKNYKT